MCTCITCHFFRSKIEFHLFLSFIPYLKPLGNYISGFKVTLKPTATDYPSVKPAIFINEKGLN